MKIRAIILFSLLFGGFLVMLNLWGQDQDQVPKIGQIEENFEITSLISGELTGEKLMVELGCNTCHSGVGDSLVINSRAPDFSYAGIRYKPSFIFDYLQQPYRIRHNIGHSRMPDFHLSKEESLALALYLGEQEVIPDLKTPFPDFVEKGGLFGAKGNIAKGKSLVQESGCFACHTTNAQTTPQVIDLSDVSKRLNPKWVKQYLVSPHTFNGQDNIMPNFFYRFNEDSTRFLPLLERPDEKINDITAYLFSLNKKEGEDLDKTFQRFTKSNKAITAALGAKIFKAQNCTACHNQPQGIISEENHAPNLAIEGSRVQKEWLNNYLKQPSPIRPHGYRPGMESRMPDFRLSDEEVNLIADYLEKQVIELASFKPEQLSVFSSNKTTALLKDKLPCLGCHQLNGKGGMLGPSLDNVKDRLKPAYTNQIIQNPHDLIPETVMPKVAMPENYVSLIVNYLYGNERQESVMQYANLINNEPYWNESLSDGKGIYLKYCAHCHGTQGNGDGFNAKNLPISPTVHSNATYISLRPDGTLYDGIHAGGYMLNKSHFMPPYGNTLQPEQIQKLVAHIRTLCDCDGPSWSLDN